MRVHVLLALCICIVFCCSAHAQAQVPFFKKGPHLDGSGKDAQWQGQPWQPINQLWLGANPTATDFAGRYKYVATRQGLYVLAVIIDDSLTDTHPDPRDHYWDDDCLELFIDPDASGADHQYNHQAFAYHLSLGGNVIDLDIDQKPISLAKHITYRRRTIGHTSTWEIFIRLYAKTYVHGKAGQKPMVLHPGQQVGFGIAYCDNDTSAERESFLGSFPIPGPDTNRGWRDASLFTKVQIGKKK